MNEENSKAKRTALLVRCTREEAEVIREVAKEERRTISGFILNAVMHRISVSHKGRTKQRNLPSRKAKSDYKKYVGEVSEG